METGLHDRHGPDAAAEGGAGSGFGQGGQRDRLGQGAVWSGEGDAGGELLRSGAGRVLAPSLADTRGGKQPGSRFVVDRGEPQETPGQERSTRCLLVGAAAGALSPRGEESVQHRPSAGRSGGGSAAVASRVERFEGRADQPGEPVERASLQPGPGLACSQPEVSCVVGGGAALGRDAGAGGVARAAAEDFPALAVRAWADFGFGQATASADSR